MAIINANNCYYRINLDKCYISDDLTLTIHYYIYKDKQSRVIEKKLQENFYSIKPIVLAKLNDLNLKLNSNLSIDEINNLNKTIQDLEYFISFFDNQAYLYNSNLSDSISIFDKYDETKKIVSYLSIFNELLGEATFNVYNFNKDNFNLEYLYALLKEKLINPKDDL